MLSFLSFLLIALAFRVVFSLIMIGLENLMELMVGSSLLVV
jgi:hypothetical protein